MAIHYMCQGRVRHNKIRKTVITWTGCREDRYLTAALYTAGSLSWSSEIRVRMLARDWFS